MSETISNLIQAAEREIRRDSEDLTRLKRRYPCFNFIRVAQEEDGPKANTARPELSYLQNSILGVIVNSTACEWTSRSVLTELTTHDLVGFPSDDAGMNAVGLALTALSEAGQIMRTHQGRGRDPHRYTSICKEDKTEAPA
jgi:hypothetical protein